MCVHCRKSTPSVIAKYLCFKQKSKKSTAQAARKSTAQAARFSLSKTELFALVFYLLISVVPHCSNIVWISQRWRDVHVIVVLFAKFLGICAVWGELTIWPNILLQVEHIFSMLTLVQLGHKLLFLPSAWMAMLHAVADCTRHQEIHQHT